MVKRLAFRLQNRGFISSLDKKCLGGKDMTGKNYSIDCPNYMKSLIELSSWQNYALMSNDQHRLGRDTRDEDGPSENRSTIPETRPANWCTFEIL